MEQNSKRQFNSILNDNFNCYDDDEPSLKLSKVDKITMRLFPRGELDI